jgi:hypothetical protein
VQSAFFREKPVEELYDETADRWEVKNLANDAAYQDVLNRMRAVLKAQLVKNRDAWLLPESEMVHRAGGNAIFTMTHDPKQYPFERIYDTADMASQRDPSTLPKLIAAMSDPDPAVRYWAAVGCVIRGSASTPAAAELQRLLKDTTSCVRIAAAEALCKIGQSDRGVDALVAELAAPDGDLLLTLNALDNVGDAAKPRAADIAANLKTADGRKDIVQANGGGGERYSQRAGADLLAKLKN